MDEIVLGKVGSGKASSLDLPFLLEPGNSVETDVKAESSATEADAPTNPADTEAAFNPLDPLPFSLSIEDAKTLAESLVVRADGSPDEA